MDFEAVVLSSSNEENCEHSVHEVVELSSGDQDCDCSVSSNTGITAADYSLLQSGGWLNDKVTPIAMLAGH